MPLVANIALVLGGAVVVAVALGLGLWWGIGKPTIATNEPWTAKEGFDFVKIVLTVVGGIGAVVALVVSYRKQRLGEAVEKREQAAETREDARLFGEDFARATEQLGSPEAPVRLAGMYTLERLAEATPKQQQTIVNVLCAYLRMPYSPPERDSAEENHKENERRKQEREVRLTAQRILAANLRPGKDPESQTGEYWTDIHLDLTGATLLAFDLRHCQLATASFKKAQFLEGADFGGAEFSGTARFFRAEFNGSADFAGVQFNGIADFAKAQFRGFADFAKAQFRGFADFTAAQFRETAIFFRAQFNEIADFTRAQFGWNALFGNAQFGWAPTSTEPRYGSMCLRKCWTTGPGLRGMPLRGPRAQENSSTKGSGAT